ncbi:iron ABC transporter ATP-binding protein [Agilicoccus flavus]|uniref:iron ABC transporter ATP-binding protein n=1 Tax=Agilicoccus flavus TaxID=2775968 RepID=UPI001CF6C2CE|nr:ATP-binding cassette domain-containing protein [Agilicoccus flavus]
MIEFENVSKTYGTTCVLGPVTGSIPSGGITSLVGPNGAGKSTLLTIMGRLLEPTTGRVCIGGLDVATTRGAELARTVSILRQENHVTARLRVRELVAFGRFPHSRGRLGPADREHIDAALSFLELEPLADRFLDQLSGGQRQRAFVAMVLAQDTSHVLLDEPLNNLDMFHAVQMMKRIRRAADELGKTFVMVVHDLNFAAAYSDRIVALRDGQVVAHDTVGATITDATLTDVFGTPVRVREIDGELTALYVRG